MLIKIIIAVALLAHGLGHVLFLGNAWGYWSAGVRPTLLVDVLHMTAPLQRFVGLLWLLPLAGFLAAAYGFYSDATWWRLALLSAAVLSTMLIFVFTNGLNTPANGYALIFNVVAIALVVAEESGLLARFTGS